MIFITINVLYSGIFAVMGFLVFLHHTIFYVKKRKKYLKFLKMVYSKGEKVVIVSSTQENMIV